MAKELNAKCSVCGKKYHLCMSCDRNKGIWKSWKQFTDTEDCFKVFTTLKEYNLNMISKEEAKERLTILNITTDSMLTDSMKKQVEEVMGNNNGTDSTDKKDNEVENKTDVKSDMKAQNASNVAAALSGTTNNSTNEKVTTKKVSKLIKRTTDEK